MKEELEPVFCTLREEEEIPRMGSDSKLKWPKDKGTRAACQYLVYH